MFNKKKELVRKFTKKENKQKKSKKYKIKKFHRRKKKKTILFWISKKKALAWTLSSLRNDSWSEIDTIQIFTRANVMSYISKKKKKEKKKENSYSHFFCTFCYRNIVRVSINFVTTGIESCEDCIARKSIIKEFLWFTITCKPSFSLAHVFSTNESIWYEKIPSPHHLPDLDERSSLHFRWEKKKKKYKVFHSLTHEGKIKTWHGVVKKLTFHLLAYRLKMKT